MNFVRWPARRRRARRASTPPSPGAESIRVGSLQLQRVDSDTERTDQRRISPQRSNVRMCFSQAARISSYHMAPATTLRGGRYRRQRQHRLLLLSRLPPEDATLSSANHPPRDAKTGQKDSPKRSRTLFTFYSRQSTRAKFSWSAQACAPNPRLEQLRRLPWLHPVVHGASALPFSPRYSLYTKPDNGFFQFPPFMTHFLLGHQLMVCSRLLFPFQGCFRGPFMFSSDTSSI